MDKYNRDISSQSFESIATFPFSVEKAMGKKAVERQEIARRCRVNRVGRREKLSRRGNRNGNEVSRIRINGR